MVHPCVASNSIRASDTPSSGIFTMGGVVDTTAYGAPPLPPQENDERGSFQTTRAARSTVQLSSLAWEPHILHRPRAARRNASLYDDDKFKVVLENLTSRKCIASGRRTGAAVLTDVTDCFFARRRRGWRSGRSHWLSEVFCLPGRLDVCPVVGYYFHFISRVD